MKKRKPRSILLSLLFCAFIGGFAVMYLLLPAQRFSEKEKRVLATFPTLSAASVFDGSFESGFEDWLSDHVPLRDQLVGLHAIGEQLSGRNGLGGVILGKDERLFAAPEAFDAEAVARKCDRINQFVEAVDLPATVMLIPTSGYMLPEYLPALHAEYHDADLARTVREKLAADIDFLWPEEDFRQDGAAELYYRTDHHYTSRGAWLACKLFVEFLGLEAVPADSYAVTPVEGFYGSMYAKAGLWSVAPDTLEIWRGAAQEGVTVSFDDREPSDSLFYEDHLADMDKYPVFLDGNHGLVTIDTDRAEGESLLILRDSFGHCFAPFAAGSFKRVVLVDLRYYRKPVSELVKAMDIDRVLVLYGADTFLTDSNFPWLK